MAIRTEDEFEEFMTGAELTKLEADVDTDVRELAARYDAPQLRRLTRQLQDIIHTRESIPF